MLIATDIANIEPGTYVAETFDADGPGALFGRPKLVVEITARDADTDGRPFVCYWTKSGATSRTSGSAKAGETRIRIVPASAVDELNDLAKTLASVRRSMPGLYAEARRTYVTAYDEIVADALEDEIDPQACPGCGCMPGDGVTDGCEHPDGCGYQR